jgi:hypothetical protein
VGGPHVKQFYEYVQTEAEASAKQSLATPQRRLPRPANYSRIGFAFNAAFPSFTYTLNLTRAAP